MTVPRISLSQQVEAVRFAETRYRAFAQGQSVKPMRGKSAEEYDMQRLGAAARTLEWLQGHEAEIKAFLALSAEARRDALAARGGPAS